MAIDVQLVVPVVRERPLAVIATIIFGHRRRTEEKNAKLPTVTRRAGCSERYLLGDVCTDNENFARSHEDIANRTRCLHILPTVQRRTVPNLLRSYNITRNVINIHSFDSPSK